LHQKPSVPTEKAPLKAWHTTKNGGERRPSRGLRKNSNGRTAERSMHSSFFASSGGEAEEID
jgi:hypothetical protein